MDCSDGHLNIYEPQAVDTDSIHISVIVSAVSHQSGGKFYRRWH